MPSPPPPHPFPVPPHLPASPHSESQTRTLTFLTSNPHKLAEVRSILGLHLNPTNNNNNNNNNNDNNAALNLKLESRSIDLPEIQAADVLQVAREKCRRGAEVINGPVLTEDTALEFRALNGLPGPYIKWFLASIGHTGLNNLLAAYDDTSAEAVCTFAYSAGPGHEPLIFQGRTLGKIVPARGPGTFGWDPIFEYQGKTYAEMEEVEKNRISHRYKALEKLKAWLVEGSNVASSP